MAINFRYLNDLPKPPVEIANCKKFLLDFQQDGRRKYMDQLSEIANRQRKELVIELDDVITMFANQDLATNIQRNTSRYALYFQEQADELMPDPSFAIFDHDVRDTIDNQRRAELEQAAVATGVPLQAKSDVPKTFLRRYQVIFLPPSFVKPRKLREIRADDIGHLVTVRGLVTRASDVKPRVTVCVYLCSVCGRESFQDILGDQFMPLLKCTSQRCHDNKTSGNLTLLSKGSRFMKFQELRLQELPDQVPTGHIPRSMTVQCCGETTRQCGPGDIVTVTGVFITKKYSGFRAITAGLQAETFLDAHRIEKQKLNFDEMILRSENEKMVREIARDIDPYGRLASSIAPEIYGHEDVKKALLLQLVGGVSRDLPDGMKIRGDINILLMGDPGVAKSQLLKYISSIAPRGVYTTGKGSSGVGLTAAVVRDPLTGDLTLEGGALVLADMGICCIDEFDKMDENDRTAIHEVMEQQTISIAKAGITTTLNARASVLAAANPLYGRYNLKKSISENVDLPNSLLSRFDLLFLILDHPNYEKDLALSKHVLHVHKHSQTPQQTRQQQQQQQQQHPLSSSTSSSTTNNTISIEAFKQYIAAARSFQPKIPKDLKNYIVEAYVELRIKDQSSTNQHHHQRRFHYSDQTTNQAIMTARQLLSILRLSQALARLRLSDLVAHQDVDEAIRITHASKASLLEEFNQSSSGGGGAGTAAPGGGGGGGYGYRSKEQVVSDIFDLIRDRANKTNQMILEYSTVETIIVKAGYTLEQFQYCLSEYESLGVVTIDSERTHISIEG